MQYRLLHYLDEVVRAGSIRQAAERLNVSSSAINRQIIDLETQLGIQIFKRMPRGLRLTASGELLVAHIRQTLRHYEHTRERMLDLEGLRAGTVSIASVHGPAAGFLPSAGLRFRRKYPRVMIVVRIVGTEEIIRLVDEGEIDIALAYNLPPQHGLQVVQTFSTRLGAVVSANHPLARRTSVRLSECAQYPIVATDVEISTSQTMRRAFRRANLPLVPAFETNSTAMIRALVMDGLHLTFTSLPDIRHERDDQSLIYIPIIGAGIPMQTLTLAHRAGAALGPAASLLLEELRASLQRSVEAVR